jgi:hypothetical protein
MSPVRGFFLFVFFGTDFDFSFVLFFTRKYAARVEVTVRVRPSLPHDGPVSQLHVDEVGGAVNVRDGSDRVLRFDHVLPPSASQAAAFTATAGPLVEAVVNGINGAIIAYGQTGAGKTYTLCELSPGRAGIIPRALATLFDRIDRMGDRYEFSVKLTYLQLYMDTVRIIFCC